VKHTAVAGTNSVDIAEKKFSVQTFVGLQTDTRTPTPTGSGNGPVEHVLTTSVPHRGPSSCRVALMVPTLVKPPAKLNSVPVLHCRDQPKLLKHRGLPLASMSVVVKLHPACKVHGDGEVY
jgi:hypothetical protein